MRRSLPALAAAGALALGGAAVPSAAAAPAPDPALLAALQQVIDTDAAAWSAAGGTVRMRCATELKDFGTIRSGGTVSYAGAGGPVRLVGPGLFNSGSTVVAGSNRATPGTLNAWARPTALTSAAPEWRDAALAVQRAAASKRSTTYLTKRYAVLPLLPRVARALERHGVARPGSWYRMTAKVQPLVPMLHAAFGSLPEVAGTAILDAGRVASLTATPVGDLTRYRGSVEMDPGPDGGTVTFVADVTATSHLSRFVMRDEGEIATSRCAARIDLRPVRVVVPRADDRHSKVAAAEAQLFTLAQGLASLPKMGNRHARVRLLQGYAYAFVDTGRRRAGDAVSVTELRDGVSLTRTVKGWKYPLRWHVRVQGRHMLVYSVRTT